MIFRNFKYAFRNLKRDKFYTLLNGSGLAIGIAAVLLIFLWVKDEVTFDQHHEKGDRIYRVLASWSFGGEKEMIATAPFPLVEAAGQVPEVEALTFFGQLWGTVLRHGDKKFDVRETKLVHAEILDIFDFEFIHGTADGALDQPTDVVLTKSMAELIYGTTDVIGQTLELVEHQDLIVSAVIEDMPSNSHFQFKILIPMEGNVSKFYGEGATHWGAYNYDCYVLLRPGIDKLVVDKKLSALIPDQEDKPESDRTSFELQALTDVYLGSGFIKYSRMAQGDWATIKTVGIIGLFILLIACINYVNLTTARSAQRAKSTGVRKIIGAGKFQLFSQYLTEVVLLVFLSGLIAFAIANVGMEHFESLTDKSFGFSQLISPSSLLIFGGILLGAILLAGIHPAVQLSSFKPLQAIRGTDFKGLAGRSGLRKFLVTAQFACSGMLIIATLVMLKQMDFVRNQKLGYEREQIFTFNCSSCDPLLFQNELSKKPAIQEVTIGNSLITDVSNRYGGFDFEGKDPERDPMLFRLSVAENFPDFFGLEIKEGRWFNPGNRDSSSFILNETAVQSLGIEDPIGKWMNFNGIEGRVVGIAKDFHFRSFHHPIEQLIFVQDFRWGMKRFYVKTTSDKTNEAIAAAQQVFQQIEPDGIFDYTFLDEAYDQLYKTEVRSSRLLAIFAGLAILISCLGVLGLAAYTAERRRKEIGIRKVLGASISNIVTLLSKEFLVLVILALFIAAPIAWYLMSSWLESFAYRIDIGWDVFVVAAIVAITIAFLTVSLQSLKAALSNPVEAIRQE